MAAYVLFDRTGARFHLRMDLSYRAKCCVCLILRLMEGSKNVVEALRLDSASDLKPRRDQFFWPDIPRFGAITIETWKRAVHREVHRCQTPRTIRDDMASPVRTHS